MSRFFFAFVVFCLSACEYRPPVAEPSAGQDRSDSGIGAAMHASHVDLAWCEHIYHRNVSCPKFGLVEVPQEVLVREEEQYLAWCERRYHRNVSCPGFGEVEVPESVLREERLRVNAWCARIGHRNVVCSGYRQALP